MKKYCVLFLVMIAWSILGALVAWPQQVNAIVDGTVTEEGKPVVDAQVILTNPDNGRTYKTKTDKKGAFSMAGVAYGGYGVKVVSKSGETIFSDKTVVGTGTSSGDNILTIQIGKELSGPGVEKAMIGGGTPGTDVGGGGKSSGPKMTKEQIKAEQEKVGNLNAMIGKAQTAMQAGKWSEAADALKQVIAAQPDTTKWELYKALADNQQKSGKPEDAVLTYDKGIQVAQSIVDGKAPKDPRNPNPDPAKAKAGIGVMSTSQGNAYVKLGKMDEAVTSFKKGAAVDPNPALAYYNLCAVQFNAGKYDDAAAACDKSIAADANKADAWFFKGAALNRAGKPGSADALNKYLQLDANGVHTADAKAMLATAK
ncbi:MAG: tetratricopeptide repeat protein [Acidobacteriia bacterium]|nr:tetratricopeptide repeat protein [Terriglobia bacterium]